MHHLLRVGAVPAGAGSAQVRACAPCIASSPQAVELDLSQLDEVDLSFVEDIDLHECFAVHRGPGPLGTGWSSLLELLDSEDRG